MSAAIVLPPLNAWAKQRLTSLITATTQADFDSAFDNFIAKSIRNITFNGTSFTRDQYKQQLQGERLLERTATINILNAVQAPKLNTQLSQNSGLVGLFFDATYIEKIIVLGAPAAHSQQSSLNITVDEDESIPLPPAGIRGDVDRRRVFSLDQISLDQQNDATPVPIVGNNNN